MTQGAGILFVNTWPQPTHCLAGYQPKRGGITGLGGKAEPGEEPFYTACREVLEELLGIESPVLTAAIVGRYSPIRQFGTEYITFVMTFQQLEDMLRDVAAVCGESAFYCEFPVTVADCVLGRQPTANAEVQELAVIPCRPDIMVLDELLEDMRAVV
jgi:8-oxo-dGTP pyrophosphatase MutT (NUDIX family)